VTETHPVVERYLARLSEHLENLSPLDRQEVLQDIRSHLAEATAAGTSLDAALESLGPADALARAYAVELLLNPRPHRPRRADRLLKIAGLIAAASLPTLFMIIVLGGVGVSFVAGGVVIIVAGIIDVFGELPAFVQTAGLPPLVTVLIGVGFTALGVMALVWLRRFVRFVAFTWRAMVPRIT
jgi:uncharacterized membrane protein